MNEISNNGDIIKYSSKVIIIDEDQNIYLEINNSLSGKLSFFGGEKEGNETPKETLIREILEELGIKISKKELEVMEVDGPKDFPKGTFLATMFILRVSRNVAELIKENDTRSGENKLIFGTYEDIAEQNVYPFAIDKSEFLLKISKALNYRF